MPAESPAEYAEFDDVRLEPHVHEPERHHHVVRVWADCSDSPAGTCNTELANYTASYAIGNIFPELTASATSLRIFQISMSGTTPSVTYAYPSGATLTTAETTAAQAVVPSTQAGVVVTVTYTHTSRADDDDPVAVS